MNEALLTELNENIKRLLNYLEPDEDEKIRHVAEQMVRGNMRPLLRLVKGRRGDGGIHEGR